LSCPVATKGAKEVDLAESRPVGVAEIELGVGRLPEQEVGQALFPGRTDDEIGLGLTGGVQVRSDVVDRELVGDVRQRGAG
jgi:hypothetical protein